MKKITISASIEIHDVDADVDDSFAEARRRAEAFDRFGGNRERTRCEEGSYYDPSMDSFCERNLEV